jgi:hypothetical protein
MTVDRSQFLTPEQVGQAFAKSPNTVRRWCRDGRLKEMGVKTFQDPGGKWWIHRDVIKMPTK